MKRGVLCMLGALIISGFFLLSPVRAEQRQLRIISIGQMPPVLQQALRHALPASCFSGSCEGLAPPPINACANSNKVVVTALSSYPSDNTWMYLYLGDCSALWVAIYYDGTGTTNEPTVNAVGVWEATSGGGGSACDGSNRGALDTLPKRLTPTSRWESTYMIAGNDSVCTNGANFHGAVDVTIHGLDSGIVNGGTYYY